MKNRGVLVAWVLVALSVVSSCSLVALAAPQCRRVIGNLGFERRLIDVDGEIVSHAPIGDGDAQGLLVATYRYDRPTSSVIQKLLRFTLTDNGALAKSGEFLLQGFSDYSVQALVSDDFNDDQIPDAFVAWGARGGRTSIVLDFFLGNAEEGFEDPQRFVATGLDRFRPPVVGDFDGDGVPQLAYLGRDLNSGMGLGVILAGWNGSELEVQSALPLESLPSQDLLALDLNGDGIDDLLRLDATHVWIMEGSRTDLLLVQQRRETPAHILSFGSRDGKLMAIEGRVVGTGWSRRIYYDTLYQLDGELQPVWSRSQPEGSGPLVDSLDLDGDGYQELQYQTSAGWREGWFRVPAVGSSVLWGSPGLPLDEARSFGTQNHLVAVLGTASAENRVLITSDCALVKIDDAGDIHDGAISTLLAESNRWDQPYGFTAAGDFNEDGLDDVIAQTFYDHFASVGISRGDGSFDFTPFGIYPTKMAYPHVTDLDGDGHLDLSTPTDTLRVAWGRGDGSFYWPAEGSADIDARRHTIDLDGQSGTDLVEWRFSDDPKKGELFTATFEDRMPVWIGPLMEVDDTWNLYQLSVGDLDGDSHVDVIAAPRTDEHHGGRLHWAKGLQDGSFAELQALQHEPLGEYILSLDVVDFDLDRRNDLILTIYHYGEKKNEIVTMRSTGSGALETMWRGYSESLGGFPETDLQDINGDGRQDLIVGHSDPLFWPSYESDIWWGDGFGHFVRSESRWGVSPGAVGKYRRGGSLDIARIRQFDETRANLELFLGLGRVKDHDELAPEVEIFLIPVIDTSAVPARFDGRWQIATVPIDDCDDRPEVIGRLIEFIAGTSAVEVEYRRADEPSIDVYELDGQPRRQKVVLMGPDESEMRHLLRAGMEAGGFPFEHWGAPVRLASSPTWGVNCAPVGGLCLVQHLEFETGGDGTLNLIGAEQWHPVRPLTIVGLARDASGKVGITRIPFQRARHDAIDRLCKTEQELPGVLGE